MHYGFLILIMERMLKFGGRHSGDPLEYAGKIARIFKIEQGGNLREIQIALADQLFGAFDFDLHGIAR